MNLKTYLESKGVSQEEFAKRLRRPVTQGMVWQWVAGKRPIAADRVRDVVEASGGEITPHECLPNVFPEGFSFPADEGARAA